MPTSSPNTASVDQLENVRHDYLRYACCWEDADILLNGLNVSSGDRILSIGSAGDNSFSLLTGDPALVVATDINPVQLHLISLKKAAFQSLDYDEFLLFLGFKASHDRDKLYQKVRHYLSPTDRLFWDQNKTLISGGVIFQGKFEKYLHLFARKILPLIHSKKRITGLLSNKTAEKQKQFFDQQWNTWRWRLLFRVFFSRWVMGKAGRDPHFFNEVNVPVSESILGLASSHLSDTACQNNHFLHFILQGDFDQVLPHYVRQENFEVIRSRIDRLILSKGYVESAFQAHGSFNQFNLSNIFEYMNTTTFQKVSETLYHHGMKNAHYFYWNLLVDRDMSKVTPLVNLKNEKSINPLTDKGFFYKKSFCQTKP